MARRRALGLITRTAEGVTWGAPANTSCITGLTYTSQPFFSLCFPERVGWRGGTPNGKQVSSTSQLQLPACCSPCFPTSSGPCMALSLVLPPRTLLHPQFGLLGLKGQSFCMTDLFPSFTLYPSLSLTLGSPMWASAGTGGEPYTWHKNMWLPVPVPRQVPCTSQGQDLPFASFPICTTGLSPRALSVLGFSLGSSGRASPGIHFPDGEKHH